ncbi:unnamed protein product [Didymodactylos carnosus]|uniref:1-phosphatidylinositol-5-phosphate 4-kinase n=2 Tax=Didymodactylos carnosus TaxID=1234261 RepID=A0A813NQ60_9BILA|nr:unnamed protein product [Didymodactylos carnosus]CAF3515060.1 unnamed protein product [Didymodactylos carnosus]
MSSKIKSGHKIKTKSKFKVQHQKHKVFRANDPLLSVLMWGVNFTNRQLDNVNIPVMLLPEHFRAYIKIRTDNQNFNKEVMPSHFKVKEYCPLVFRAFREYWKIHDSSFRDSLSDSPIPLDQLTKSTLPIYLSSDRRFILKCITKEDVGQIHQVLPEYHRYIVETQGDTLLPHFYAMYRLTVDDKENYILVTKNVISSRLRIHAKYDVKGSTVDRSASDKEKSKGSPTLKDNDFINDKRIIEIGDQKRTFMDKLKRDVNFLVTQYLMDYSLLIGIHDIEKGGVQEKEYTLTSGSEMATSDLSGNESDNNNPSGSESPTPGNEEALWDDETFMIRSSENSARRELYWMALIDFTYYGMKKKGANVAKTMKYGGDEISTVNPEHYARRFLDFIEKVIV